MRKSRFILLTAAAAILISGMCGCSAFRAIFGGSNVADGYKRESRRREERKERKKRPPDPVADMFDIRKQHEPAPRHMGISLSESDRRLVEREEKALERDRLMINKRHRELDDERRERTKWVYR